MDGSTTLCEMIDALPRCDSAPAIISLHRESRDTWSYRELGTRIRRLAMGLTKVGLRPGDTAALFARNSPEWIIACLAIIRAGGVAVPLDAQMNEATLRRVLRDSRAKFVFTTSEEERILRNACDTSGLSMIRLDGQSGDAPHWQYD